MDGDQIGTGPRVATDGEFAGWSTWSGHDPFEDQTGPFYFMEDAEGVVTCAFRAEARHMNGGGFMHGGCMLTFADFALFAIAHRALVGVHAVTVSLNGEFVGPAKVGDRVEARGEVVRAGGSLVFVRGTLSTGGGPLLSFSGVIKKTRPREKTA